MFVAWCDYAPFCVLVVVQRWIICEPLTGAISVRGASITIDSTLKLFADSASTGVPCTQPAVGPAGVGNLNENGACGAEPAVCALRSGRKLKNWNRSKKNGSARGPTNTFIPLVHAAAVVEPNGTLPASAAVLIVATVLGVVVVNGP